MRRPSGERSAYWRLGQYTGFSGYEACRRETCTSPASTRIRREQGFLNGAVNSGERAASEVLHQI
jgi:monoamine oxidase